MSTTIGTKTGRYEATRTGSVKVGRWTYPVIERTDGQVVRNEKTDGSLGFSIPVDTGVNAVEWDAPSQNGYTELSPLDKAMLAQIGNTQRGRRSEGNYFDFFDDGIVEYSGIWFAHAADQTNDAKSARRAFKSLHNKGYIVIGEPQEAGDSKDRWMHLTAKGAEAALAFAGQSTELPKSKAGHTAGGGNQTKRPGKSEWKLGGKCPQGTHTLTAKNLYVMPSGRSQCRDCRAEMPSRVKSLK